MDHNKLWKILKEMGIPDHLTCLLRNLYAGPGSCQTGLFWDLGLALPLHRAGDLGQVDSQVKGFAVTS